MKQFLLTFLLLFSLGMTATAAGTDVLTNASLNNGTNTNSGGYKAFQSGTFTSGAKYAGGVNFQVNKGVYSIAINAGNSSCKGIVTTVSGGVAKSVKITWCTQPTTSNGRVVKIYGQNTAYSTTDKAEGTEIGSCTKGSNASETITLTNQTYQYIAINAPSVVYIDSIEIEWGTPAAAEKVTLTSDGLVVTDENDQTLNADGSYEYAAPTKISFAYTGDTGVANPDITYSYSVDGAPAVEGNEYTYEADKDVTLTVNAISSNTVSKTINLNKQWPTECPLPVFSVENNAEVQQGQTISVSCEGAKDLIWTVNDTDIEGTSYTVTEAPGTTLTFYAIASVDGKTGELTAENSITVKVVEATSATFDFANNTYGLTPQTDGGKYEPDMENPVTAITSGIATIKFEGAKYRYWKNKSDLRVQSGSTFTISVPDGYYITGIDITGTSTSTVDAGKFTSGTWTPTEDAINSSVKFSPTTTTNITKIVVNYAVDTTSGIADVVVDGNDSAEYFNLQGLRVAQPEAGQIYIRVQNGKASKLRF